MPNIGEIRIGELPEGFWIEKFAEITISNGNGTLEPYQCWMKLNRRGSFTDDLDVVYYKTYEDAVLVLRSNFKGVKPIYHTL